MVSASFVLCGLARRIASTREGATQMTFEALMAAFQIPAVWPAIFVRFEAGLLDDLGFGLDLGAGVDIGSFTVEFRYYLGLMNLTEVPNASSKARGIGFLGGFRF